MSLKAIVKSVLSADSLLLRGRPGPQGQPAKERILNLADITSPRMGSSNREDEPWAFEAREFMRVLAVGKEITFVCTHSLPPNDDTPRDFGNGEIGGLDLASELLKNGWAKANDRKREPTEEDHKRKDLEAEAKAAGKGIWNPHGPKAYTVNYTMPLDAQAFLSEHKGKPIDGIVEQVREGTTVRVRLLLPDSNEHQLVNVAMAGVRSARAASRQGDVAEPWGEEARFFTESRLLQRAVKVQLLSVPAPTASPFQASASIAPTPVSIFIGNVLHPNGNVAEHLVASGLARVVDWHAGMLAGGGMERLRAAEKVAKERKLYLYANTPSAPSNVKPGNGHATNGSSRTFDGTVVRVWSGDQISVVDKDSKEERRIQLSSTRGPKASDPKQAWYAAEAKEFLRKKLIGKHVRVHIDFIRPAEGEFEERECATVRYGNQNHNIAEQIIEKGLATAVRHKRDDENRSPDYDKLIIAEKAAVDDARGIHSGKEQSLPRIGNASESMAKANQFLSGFKRQGRVPAVVDYVAGGSRFRILLPKENQSLTLVLGGIRAPRNAPPATRTSTRSGPPEKAEPYGAEAAAFSTHRYMQRDVEIEFEAVDKTGGFIGALYLNKTENAAIALVQEGLATVHAYSAEGLSWSNQLFAAEEAAKKERRNIWKDFDEEAAAKEQETQSNAFEPKVEYLDIIVSDIRSEPSLNFSVQILNTEGIASLEKLMHDFSLHHRSAASTPGFIPKQGELVSAKFSDGSWYRAKIRRAYPLKREADVTFIDYGNQDTIPYTSIRPLDSKFRALPGQAQDARLSFIKLADSTTDYGAEALDRFRSLAEGRKLIANVDYREGNLLHLRLIDPSDSSVTSDPSASINADLAREGLASLDRKGCKYLNSYPEIVKKIQESINLAKRERLGMFELGDVEDDD
ncbi:transcription factor [Sistotremastrum niveocremeum HHB9708]|uniref:Transcription factor n=1 Tax=Sistotremastrum niveocremeum HHB9708 TaxID=1314777 RepID=A0A165A161_9AGAM|nr:transcription factor [Sistotremastrum niveocremeum HHB9708]